MLTHIVTHHLGFTENMSVRTSTRSHTNSLATAKRQLHSLVGLWQEGIPLSISTGRWINLNRFFNVNFSCVSYNVYTTTKLNTMVVNGPIVFIDDDEDDQLILKPILEEIAPLSPILFFTSGQLAVDYLKTTEQRPFLIISEVNLAQMDGLELRRQIEEDTTLKKRAIPFIFFTHPVYKHMVEEAYDLTIQGFFEKMDSISEIRDQLQAIIDYWSKCLHPNRFTDED